MCTTLQLFIRVFSNSRRDSILRRTLYNKSSYCSADNLYNCHRIHVNVQKTYTRIIFFLSLNWCTFFMFQFAFELVRYVQNIIIWNTHFVILYLKIQKHLNFIFMLDYRYLAATRSILKSPLQKIFMYHIS